MARFLVSGSRQHAVTSCWQMRIFERYFPFLTTYQISEVALFHSGERIRLRFVDTYFAMIDFRHPNTQSVHFLMRLVESNEEDLLMRYATEKLSEMMDGGSLYKVQEIMTYHLASGCKFTPVSSTGQTVYLFYSLYTIQWLSLLSSSLSSSERLAAVAAEAQCGIIQYIFTYSRVCMQIDMVYMNCVRELAPASIVGSSLRLYIVCVHVQTIYIHAYQMRNNNIFKYILKHDGQKSCLNVSALRCFKDRKIRNV